jgi:hypothetical protein
VKCSLIEEYVKKPSAHGTSTFNGSNVLSKKFVRNVEQDYWAPIVKGVALTAFVK